MKTADKMVMLGIKDMSWSGVRVRRIGRGGDQALFFKVKILKNFDGF